MNALLTDLRRSFSGAIHLPGTDGYDRERATFADRVDQHPAVVVEATSASDVRAAIAAAHRHGLPFAVQSTGHGTHAPNDGGILVKTGALKQILVDPDRRVARVGAGVTNGELAAAAAPLGLTPVVGSHGSVGVAGFTLGGGAGWLSRAYGFAADNLAAAEVVTTDGQLLRVDGFEHPDLFWALRGGGGSFAVVTAFEVRLHPVTTVLAGEVTFAPDQARAILTAFAAGADARPNALTANVIVGPDAVTIRTVYAGDEREGRAALQPLLDAGGTRVSERLSVIKVGDVDLGGTAPRHFELLPTLPVDAIVQAAQHARAIEVRQWGGAMARTDAGPVGHRDVPWSVTIDGPELAAIRIRPYAHGGTFRNFDPSRIDGAYTSDDLRRLQTVKRTWDPENVLGGPIAPAPVIRRAA